MAENSRIGAKITTLRESLGLSVTELAERCECDPGVIEQLEAGEVATSLAPLIKITRALGVRLGTLVDDDTQVGPVVTRKDAGANTERVRDLETGSGGGTLDFYSLAEGKTSRHMEPFIVTLEPTTLRSSKTSVHDGEEFIFVLEGAMEVILGDHTDILHPGDSIYYDSTIPHRVQCHEEKITRILAVLYTASQGAGS